MNRVNKVCYARHIRTHKRSFRLAFGYVLGVLAIITVLVTVFKLFQWKSNITADAFNYELLR